MNKLSVLDARGISHQPLQRIQLEHDHECSVCALAITPDGHRVVYGGEDRSMRVWDLEENRCVAFFDGYPGTAPEKGRRFVCDVALTPDGQWAVSGSEGGRILFWDLGQGRCRFELEGDPEAVRAVAITPDGRRALSSGTDRLLRLWDAVEGRCLSVLEGHGDEVECVAITADGRRAFSGGWDNAREWDLERGECLGVFDIHCVHHMSATPDGRRVLCGGCGHRVRIWDMERRQCIHTLRGSSPIDVSLSDDGRLAVVSPGYGVTVWDTEQGRFRAYQPLGQEDPATAHLLADGRIVTWDWNGVLNIWPSVLAPPADGP